MEILHNASGNQRLGRWPVNLCIILFLFLGVSALIWFGFSVRHNPFILLDLEEIEAGLKPSSSIIIAFLTEFGIVLPVLVIGLSAASIRLALKLRSRDIAEAQWAQVTLLWLVAASSFGAFIHLFRMISRLFQQDTEKATAANQANPLLLIAFISAAILFFLLRKWMKRYIDSGFYGKELLHAREIRTAWNLMIPTLIMFLIVAARPLEQTFIRSLTDKRFAGQEVPNFVGLQNYANLLGFRFDIVDCRIDEATNGCSLNRNGSIQWENIDIDLLKQNFRTVWTFQLPFDPTPSALAVSGLDQAFLKAIGTTLFFTIISVTLELLIALFMATTVNSEFVGRGLMRAAMLVPWAIPTVISARLWELMLKDTSAGIVNRILMDIGIFDAPQAWLANISLQLPAAIMVDVWKTAPFMALLLLAGLQTIPKDLYEASSVDGASRAQQFFRITLPLLQPTIAVALVFRTLDSLRVFDLFNVLFGRQQLSMATYNYEILINSQRDGYASAVSMIIFMLISVFAFVYVRLLNVETE